MKPIKIEIPLNPVTKKNHQQIFLNRASGKPFVSPSPQYKRYLADCGYFLERWRGMGIDFPVNVKCIYYMKTARKVDLTNLLECTDDVLVHCGILADDNSGIVAGHDGSRVRYDKKNPRTEIIISSLKE